MAGALVTGAGRGMGLEIARRLIGRGYEVAVTDVDEANTFSAAEQLGQRAWSLPLTSRTRGRPRRRPAGGERRATDVCEQRRHPGDRPRREQDVDVYRRLIGVIPGHGQRHAGGHRPDAKRRTRAHHQPDLARRLAAATGSSLLASKHARRLQPRDGRRSAARRAGGIQIRASPDGIWTPMTSDKLDDPNDAFLLGRDADARAGR